MVYMWDDEYIGIVEMGRQRHQQQRHEMTEMTEADACNGEDIKRGLKGSCGLLLKVAIDT